MKRSRAVAGATVLLTILTGCSGASGGGSQARPSTPTDPKAALMAAVAKMEQAETASSFRVAGTFSGLPELDGRIQGQLKVVQGSFHEGELTFDSKEGKTRILYAKDGLYVHAPDKQLAAQADGKEWMKLGYKDLESSYGQSFRQLADTQKDVDPRPGLREMAATARRVGAETVNGVATDHYVAQVPVEVAVKEAPAEQREALRERFAQLGAKEYTVDLGLGQQDQLPRRIKTVISMGGKQATILMGFSDYGIPVEVTPPPASEVMDLGQMLRELGDLAEQQRSQG